MSCCIEAASRGFCAESGQATVEAAFALPVIFALMGLLLQPAVLLYDRCIMQSAAAETCRLVATGSCGSVAAQGFALRRLAAVPALDLFHTQACAWGVQVEDAGASGCATVSIKGHVKTLPLLGITASTMTSAEPDGCALLSCEVSSRLHPTWLADAQGTAQEWIALWS